jgi:AraC family transcriptional regulator
VRILAIVIAISLIAFFGLSYYAGVLDKIDVSQADAGPYNLIYRQHKGPYGGVRAVVYDVSRYLTEKRSIAPRKGFAVFYDNPRTKKQEELRSIGGYITDSLLADVAAPYVAAVFPKAQSIVGIFPLRSFMSPLTGPMKFYPKMAELLVQKKREAAGPVMEIYDVAARKILYIAPLK